MQAYIHLVFANLHQTATSQATPHNHRHTRMLTTSAQKEQLLTSHLSHLFTCKGWAAANGCVTNGILRGVRPPFLEIGQNRPFSPFFCIFCCFPEGAKSTWKIQKTEEKNLLYPQLCLNPHFLNPHLWHSKKGRASNLDLTPRVDSACAVSVLVFWFRLLLLPGSWASSKSLRMSLDQHLLLSPF